MAMTLLFGLFAVFYMVWNLLPSPPNPPDTQRRVVGWILLVITVVVVVFVFIAALHGGLVTGKVQ